MLERLFIGWRQPLLPQTVRILQERYAHGSVWDMSTVLPAGAEDAATVSVGLSPTVSLDAAGIESQPDPQTGYPRSGGNAHDTALLTRAVHPIELTSPNVFKRPDTLGDGGNQFVYGGQQPDGYLYVPGAVTVTGGSQDDAQWLVDNNKIDMKVEDSTIGGVFTHGWAVAGSRILLDTSYTDENGMQASSFGWVFKGLPADNSGFGNHEVNLYMDGGKSETAHIQTFYTGTASNFPGSAGTFSPDGSRVPNWYHYYEPFFTSGNAEYNNTDRSNCGPYQEAFNQHLIPVVHIGNDAYPQHLIPIFGVKCEKSPFVRFLGTLSLIGIHSYVYVVGHEEGHAAAWTTPGMEDIDSNLTRDKDLLVDSWEYGHHLDNHSPDTTGAYGSYSHTTGHIILPDGTEDMDTADNEVVAEIAALGYLLNNRDLWQQDWADRGVQRGILHSDGSFDVGPVDFTPPDFFWKFIPYETPTGGPPPVTNPYRYYNVIRNLQDLKDLYPGTTIATDWSNIEGTCPPIR